MPIAFPPAPQYTSLNDASKLFIVPGIQVNPNMARPGMMPINGIFDPGIGQSLVKAVNLRQLGMNYRAVTNNAIINPVNIPINDKRIYFRQQDYSNLYLMGVTRDTTGNTLGLCRVMVFRTEDNSFVGETTSDASGNYTILMNKAGAFFVVSYKAGSPDVTGATVNTLTAA